MADLPAANERAVAWCSEVNAALHSQTCAVPAGRLEQERELLTSLPSLRPSIGPAPVTHKVDKLSTVRIGSARYSVPTWLAGTRVAVVVDGPRLLILDPGTGVVHAEHPLKAPGEASILDERAIRPKTVAEQQFCSFGPVAEAFIAGAAAAGDTRLGPELAELNTLAAAHGEDTFVAALERAVAFARWKAAHVRSILAGGVGTPQPRPDGDALVIDLPVATVRQLAEYTPAKPAPPHAKAGGTTANPRAGAADGPDATAVTS